ncbi:hypothetical protein FRC09_016976 [Ceratobasidium sp. 395]|nr:hypothetical protein FRC09_016976 [Ceratobasidium sp. 395]
MVQTTLLEEWLGSPSPTPISLPEFNQEARKIPLVFDAPVRHVGCHRLGIHEYILVACSVKLPTSQRAAIAYFRLERNPTEKTARLLSGKSTPAADTIRMNMRRETLHQENSLAVRGYFVFNQVEDNAPKTLMLKHIIEMHDYLAHGSLGYTFLGTNCRWFCSGLLECLRACQPCFGGQWTKCTGKDTIPKQDTQAAIRAKARYLKEKHPDCCHLRPSSIMSALVAEATAIGAAVSNMVEIAGQAQNQAMAQSATDPNVIYSTMGPTTPSVQPTQLPSAGMNPMANHAPSPPLPNGIPAFADEPGVFYDEPATYLPQPSQYPHHAHPQHRPVSHMPPPLPQPSFDTHIGGQMYGVESTSHLQYESAPHGHPPIPRTWSGATGPCSCPQCVYSMHSSGLIAGRPHPSQVPQNHYHHHGPPPQPRPARTYQRPTPVNMGTLHGIPEAHAPDATLEYDYNPYVHPTPVLGQTHRDSTYGYHPPPPSIPMSQRAPIGPHSGPHDMYMRGSINGSMNLPYQGYNMHPSTTRSVLQPRQPQPTRDRWLSRDGTMGIPVRTDSPTQMDDVQLNVSDFKTLELLEPRD